MLRPYAVGSSSSARRASPPVFVESPAAVRYSELPQPPAAAAGPSLPPSGESAVCCDLTLARFLLRRPQPDAFSCRTSPVSGRLFTDGVEHPHAGCVLEITWDIRIAAVQRYSGDGKSRGVTSIRGIAGFLLEDLSDRGMLKTAIVTALGEVRPDAADQRGRRPRSPSWRLDNAHRRRADQGGRIIGESDELGYTPKSRPVSPGEVAATFTGD